jgi:hypothetical protein
MPKRVLILLAMASLAVAASACGGNGSSPTPTPAPSATYTPNPNIRDATIFVSIVGQPANKIPVEESTPIPGTFPPGRPGKTFDTRYTDYKGIIKFWKLDTTKTYCWTAVLSKTSTSSLCADWQTWQTNIIDLGT